MALRRFGFIVKGAGYEPGKHTVTLASPEITTTVVGVATPEQALAVADWMVQTTAANTVSTAIVKLLIERVFMK